MPKVIVYTKLNCPNCEHVKWGLSGLEVPHEIKEIEVTAKTDAVEAEKNLRDFLAFGVMSVPVTVFPTGEHMEGFHHGKFTEHLNKMGYDL